MGNLQFSVFIPLFGKQWVKSCIAYTGKICRQLMLFLQVWYVISLLHTAIWRSECTTSDQSHLWGKICALIVAQVTFPFPGEKDGGLASTRLAVPSERANNMVTTI